MTATRLFRGGWSLGPFHCHPFRLSGKGSHTILHQHQHDHLISSDRDILIYRTGPEEVHRMARGDRRLVKAHVWHLIVAAEDGDTECECLFSRYDEAGEFLLDPKEGSRQPYSEPCDLNNLPAMVRGLLDA